MDKNVSTRFFKVHQSEDASASFEQALTSASGIPNVAQRERNVSDNCVVRLETLDVSRPGFLLGDLTRVQTENLPSKVTDIGTDRLDEDKIGHGVAFLYDINDRILAIQFDNRAVSPGRACKYARNFMLAGTFVLFPILRNDAWARFDAETPTSFSLSLAGITDFSHIPNHAKTDFEESIEVMARQHATPIIKIEAKIEGNNPANATIEGMRNTVRRWLQFRSGDDVNVKRISATTIESDEPIDFLKFVLKESRTLDLEPNDPAANRQRRMEFVQGCYQQHRGYLLAYRE